LGKKIAFYTISTFAKGQSRTAAFRWVEAITFSHNKVLAKWAYLLPILVGISCEEPIDVTLPEAETQLVIDAIIGYDQSNGSPQTTGQVKLTLTSPFFASGTSPVEGANASIIDVASGAVFVLAESEPGTFTEGFPEVEFEKEYTLEVTYENQVFQAAGRLIPTAAIDKVEQGDRFLFDPDEETEVIVTFTDIPDQRNHYLFSFGFGNFLVTDDEFYQNSNLTFSYFYEDVRPNDELTITVLGVDEGFANYMDQVIVQSGEDGGGPFAVPPATVRGNIINVTNPDNFAFGYFSISEFNSVALTVK